MYFQRRNTPGGLDQYTTQKSKNILDVSAPTFNDV